MIFNYENVLAEKYFAKGDWIIFRFLTCTPGENAEALVLSFRGKIDKHLPKLLTFQARNKIQYPGSMAITYRVAVPCRASYLMDALKMIQQNKGGIPCSEAHLKQGANPPSVTPEMDTSYHAPTVREKLSDYADAAKEAVQGAKEDSKSTLKILVGLAVLVALAYVARPVIDFYKAAKS